MKVKSRIWFLLLLVFVPGLASAENKISKERLEFNGEKRTYYLLVPKSIEGQKSVPLLVLFHGSNRDGLSLAEKWKGLAEKEGFIVAAPDASEPRAWRFKEDGQEFLRQLVETLLTKYPINHRRVYLFGHSAGAVFSLGLSVMQSEYFAATALHAGSWRSAEEFAVLEHAKRKTPIAVFVGDRDAFFPLDSVKATDAALKARGFPVETTVIKGHDHWYYDIAPEINQRAWQFLKQHELNEEPRYATYNLSGNRAELNATLKAINESRTRFNQSLKLFYAREEDLRLKAGDAEATAKLVQAQLDALTEGASALQQSSEKAEQLSKMNLGRNYAEYYGLIAEVDRKRLEAVAVMRERAAMRVSSETAATKTSKMNEAAIRIEGLHAEASELERKAELLLAGQRR